MEKRNIIGKVSATENKPSTCEKFSFWVDDDVLLSPFDIVKIPHLKDSYTYAIVEEMNFVTDSQGHLSSYVSSDFGNVEEAPLNKRLGTTVAVASVLHNTKNIDMPIRDGEVVQWADEEGIRKALGVDNIASPIPSGWIETSNDISVGINLDSRYLLGPEGAHLNIAGISGLATKTSYAMFLLNSIQQSVESGENVTIIIFNVKGSDLLAIDKKENSLSEDIKRQWEKCGLKAEPFSNVKYFYPFANKENNFYSNCHNDRDIVKSQHKNDQAWNYIYDVKTILDKRVLPLLFSDISDDSISMESIMNYIGESSDFEVEDWDTFKSVVRAKTQSGRIRSNVEISIQSWRKFSRLLSTRIKNDLFTSKSISSGKRQIYLYDALLKNLKPGNVIVIDIEPLPDYLQAMVFGDVVRTIYSAKLGDYEEDGYDPRTLGKVVLFADELNKYGPKISHGSRNLTASLLEISERGRSLGVVLFGAEQFRSDVHDRILGNCGTNVYGRTSPIEIKKCQDYKYFPSSYQANIVKISQGTLLLQHPIFKTSLIRLHFPKPCYYQPKGK